MKGIKILYVDDDPILRELTEEIFRGKGAEVTTAVDGSEGLEKAKSGTFDVIMTDNRMPRMFGQQMAAKIMDEGISTPIILVTADSGLQLLPKEVVAIKICVQKPLDYNKLEAVIKKLIEK